MIAVTAIAALDRTDFGGRNLAVSEARPRQERGGGGGGGATNIPPLGDRRLRVATEDTGASRKGHSDAAPFLTPEPRSTQEARLTPGLLR
jgi:hypothetical protein